MINIKEEQTKLNVIKELYDQLKPEDHDKQAGVILHEYIEQKGKLLRFIEDSDLSNEIKFNDSRLDLKLKWLMIGLNIGVMILVLIKFSQS